MAPEGAVGGGGHRQGQWPAGILPDLMPRASVSPFCQLATILTAAPCHHPVTSPFSFQGPHPSHKKGPPGEWRLARGGQEVRPGWTTRPTPTLLTPVFLGSAAEQSTGKVGTLLHPDPFLPSQHL